MSETRECGSGTCISVQPWDIKGTAVVIRSDYFKTLHGNPEHDDDAALLATKEEWQAFRRQVKSGEWDHIFPDEISEHDRAMAAGAQEFRNSMDRVQESRGSM